MRNCEANGMRVTVERGSPSSAIENTKIKVATTNEYNDRVVRTLKDKIHIEIVCENLNVVYNAAMTNTGKM